MSRSPVAIALAGETVDHAPVAVAAAGERVIASVVAITSCGATIHLFAGDGDLTYRHHSPRRWWRYPFRCEQRTRGWF
jgi:hypothetical protein